MSQGDQETCSISRVRVCQQVKGRGTEALIVEQYLEIIVSCLSELPLRVDHKLDPKSNLNKLTVVRRGSHNGTNHVESSPESNNDGSRLRAFQERTIHQH